MNKVFRIILATILILSNIVSIPSFAAPSSNCRISSSPNQLVSLGFPIAAERLANKVNPKILVIPLRYKDNPKYVFDESQKKKFEQAAKNIFDLSDGKMKIQFHFANLQDIPFDANDMVILKANAVRSIDVNEGESTDKFVRKLVTDLDSKINFSGIDAIYFQGSLEVDQGPSYIAEAFMFQSEPKLSRFQSLQTQEGSINNVVFVNYSSVSSNTITHEILHNFGLTDLYGSPNSPSQLSLMNGNVMRLLTYEKWVLGWLPDSLVQCLDERNEIDFTQVATRLTLPIEGANQILILRNKEAGTALIIETSSRQSDTGSEDVYLSFYSLDNEKRPPISLYSQKPGTGDGVLIKSGEFAEESAVSTKLVSSRYVLLISNISENGLILDLIPTSQFDKAGDLISKADLAKQELRNLNENKRALLKIKLEADAKAKAEADAKAKAEADAKAKAEADAKAKAEADAKAKAEADAKAKVITAPSSAKKIVSITCVKGKLVKKISGTAPKCPAGYTKK